MTSGLASQSGPGFDEMQWPLALQGEPTKREGEGGRREGKREVRGGGREGGREGGRAEPLPMQHGAHIRTKRRGDACLSLPEGSTDREASEQQSM